jgi:hypothetical protein
MGCATSICGKSTDPPTDIYCTKSDAGVSIKLLKAIQSHVLQKDEDRLWTTRNVVDRVIKPLTKSGRASLIETLFVKNRILQHNEFKVVYNEVVHDSDIFVSHAWSGNFHGLVEAIDNFLDVFGYDPESTFFWIDIAAVNQWSKPLKRAMQSDTWFTGVLRSIVEMHKHTLLVCDPWDAPRVASRIWCMWELHCSLSSGAKLSVGLSNDQSLELKRECRERPDLVLGIQSKVDVRKGKARSWRDRKGILKAFSEEPGGIPAVNEALNEFLGKGILQEYEEYSIDYIGKYHLCLAKKKVI